MQIGEVIRKYRKNLNITQEEMATRLGVTAPAVNKWEKGNSLPDIMLLTPIARLLNITLETLLSFHKELSDEEVNNLVNEASIRLKNESYDEAFQWAKKKIELYPNCEELILSMLQIFDAQGCVIHIPNSEKYDKYINERYIRLLNSNKEEIRTLVADSLFNFYLRKKKYEKAEKYLEYFSSENPERKRKQAIIYSKTNRIKEAYKSYEELLFSGYQRTNMVFQSIYMLAIQEGDINKAHNIINKQKQLANLFEMGEYHEVSPELELAVMEKDIDTTIRIMEIMLSSVEEMDAFRKSSLYEHMIFREIKEGFIEEIKENLLETFGDEETFGFLKEDKRWEKLRGKNNL